MTTYETAATVQEQGRVHVAGVPFAPGTEVDVTISPAERTEDVVARLEDTAPAVARDRLREPFRTSKGFRKSPRVPREELPERGRLR